MAGVLGDLDVLFAGSSSGVPESGVTGEGVALSETPIFQSKILLTATAWWFCRTVALFVENWYQAVERHPVSFVPYHNSIRFLPSFNYLVWALVEGR